MRTSHMGIMSWRNSVLCCTSWILCCSVLSSVLCCTWSQFDPFDLLYYQNSHTLFMCFWTLVHKANFGTHTHTHRLYESSRHEAIAPLHRISIQIHWDWSGAKHPFEISLIFIIAVRTLLVILYHMLMSFSSLVVKCVYAYWHIYIYIYRHFDWYMDRKNKVCEIYYSTSKAISAPAPLSKT